MKRSTDRLLATHAGSMIRPPEGLALTPHTDDATRTEVLRKAMQQVVNKQVECGIDIVSDGDRCRTSSGRKSGLWLKVHGLRGDSR